MLAILLQSPRELVIVSEMLLLLSTMLLLFCFSRGKRPGKGLKGHLLSMFIKDNVETEELAPFFSLNLSKTFSSFAFPQPKLCHGFSIA